MFGLLSSVFLSAAVTVVTAVELDLNRCGKLRLTADAPGTIPAALAILTPLDGLLPKLGDEFSVGVNETGVFPPHGSWAQRFCGIDGRDFAAHMALLRACGVQHLRVFNEDYGHFPVLSPSRGTFDATTLEPFLAALEKSGMPAYFTMKFSLSRLRGDEGGRSGLSARGRLHDAGLWRRQRRQFRARLSRKRHRPVSGRPLVSSVCGSDGQRKSVRRAVHSHVCRPREAVSACRVVEYGMLLPLESAGLCGVAKEGSAVPASAESRAADDRRPWRGPEGLDVAARRAAVPAGFRGNDAVWRQYLGPSAGADGRGRRPRGVWQDADGSDVRTAAGEVAHGGHVRLPLPARRRTPGCGALGV